MRNRGAVCRCRKQLRRQMVRINSNHQEDQNVDNDCHFSTPTTLESARLIGDIFLFLDFSWEFLTNPLNPIDNTGYYQPLFF